MAIKSLSTRIDDNTLIKLNVIADYEDRSANSQLLMQTDCNAMKECIKMAKLFCRTSRPLLIYAEAGLDTARIIRNIHTWKPICVVVCRSHEVASQPS